MLLSTNFYERKEVFFLHKIDPNFFSKFKTPENIVKEVKFSELQKSVRKEKEFFTNVSIFWIIKFSSKGFFEEKDELFQV